MALKQWKRIPAHKTPLRADVNQSVCCWRALCHAGARPWTESDGRARFFTALGKTPHCLQLSRPHVFSFFFFFLTNWLWGFYDWCTYRKNHFCQASSVTCPWDMTSPLPRIALSNQIFPGQCKLWQIPSSCIMRFPANLPNSRESGRVSWFQLRGMLSDWMMLKPQPSTSLISPFPAATTSSLLSFHILPKSLGLVSTGALTTWTTKQLCQSRGILL